MYSKEYFRCAAGKYAVHLHVPVHVTQRENNSMNLILYVCQARLPNSTLLQS
jgi:hypothetical protein